MVKENGKDICLKRKEESFQEGLARTLAGGHSTIKAQWSQTLHDQSRAHDPARPPDRGPTMPAPSLAKHQASPSSSSSKLAHPVGSLVPALPEPPRGSSLAEGVSSASSIKFFVSGSFDRR